MQHNLIGNISENLHVAKISNLEGDFTICQRKGKLFCIYDISFEAEVEAKDIGTFTLYVKDLLSDCSGYLDFECSARPSGLSAEFNKDFQLWIYDKFEMMKKEACEEQGQELVKPIENNQEPSKPSSSNSIKSSTRNETKLPASSDSSFACETLTMKINFNCSASIIWDCLFDEKLCNTWSQCSGSQVLPVVGSSYRIFNGNITGEFLEVEDKKRVVLTWRNSSWPSGHFSKLILTFVEYANESWVNLVQENVPSSHVEVTQQNWNQFIWGPIKGIFGYGAF